MVHEHEPLEETWSELPKSTFTEGRPRYPLSLAVAIEAERIHAQLTAIRMKQANWRARTVVEPLKSNSAVP